MHWIYAFYLFACTAHVPIFITLTAVGKYVPQMRLVANNQTKYLFLQNNATCFQSIQSSLSVEAGFAALMAVAFGLLFMFLTNDQAIDESGRLFLASRPCFWGFVWFHSCVLHSGWPTPVVSADAAAGLRLLSLWCICSPIDKGWPSFAGTAIGYLLWIIVFIEYHWGFPWPLFLMQLSIDALLVVSHWYDARTPPDVLLNCRLCYVALSGFILHVASVMF